MPIVTASRSPRSVPRAEAVGSLLRSPAITSQIDKLYEGETTPLRELVLAKRTETIAELNRLADEAIVDLVQHQIDAGLDVVTDGEMRRATFLSTFYDAVTGFASPAERLVLHDDNGEVLYEGFNDPVVADRVRKAYSPPGEEASFMRAVTDFPFKITMPAPSYYFTDFIPLGESTAYSNKREFVDDAVEILKTLAAEAIAAGARWIQFDFPLYPALVAESFSEHGSMIEEVRGQGETEETLLEQALEVDKAVVADIPDDVTIAMHLCRGNFPGGFWSGSLAPVAERMFNELPFDRFLFEWEDIGREGDYSPIKYVPKDKIMAMGVVSTKVPELESEDEIVRRIEEASKHLPVEQLAVVPQCGFASLYADALVEAQDAQWRKLELIGKVADRVWGSS
jgi:5-methyltetrahydropteroyltriglutamate--homocysteine methyltransferase